VSISSENNLPVIYVFGYTAIVVYDGLMRVTDVGTTVGDIGIWEVGSREKLALNNFEVNYLNTVSISHQANSLRSPRYYWCRNILFCTVVFCAEFSRDSHMLASGSQE
ncbi:hypothetical protein Tco_0784782, partial [Tanacetum coccineum]